MRTCRAMQWIRLCIAVVGLVLQHACEETSIASCEALGSDTGSTRNLIQWGLHKTRTASSKAHISDVISLLPSEASRTLASMDFKDCGIVGSASILNGKGHGHDIDAHGTVIRMNRLPVSKYAEDHGRRTDVLMVNHWEQRHGKVALMGPSRKHCGGSPACAENIDCTKGGVNCNFRALITRGWDGCNRAGKYCKGVLEELHRVWGAAPFAVGMQHPNISAAAGKLLHKTIPTTPSTGFQALITFAPICDSVTLYGMAGGSKTADNHKEEKQHSFTMEHLLIERLASGLMFQHDWPKARLGPNLSTSWLQEHMGSIKLVK